MFGKSRFLDLEPSAMIHADSFLTSTDDRSSEVFVDVWLSLDKSIGEFSTVY